MRLSNFCFVFVLFIFSHLSITQIYAQEQTQQPPPVCNRPLVEFGDISCSDSMARLDGVAKIIGEPCSDDGIEILRTRCPCGMSECRVANANYKDPFDVAMIDMAFQALPFELENDPKKSSYIIVYAGRKSKKDEAKIVASRMKDYLINKRGVSPSRIEAIDGGYREKPSLDIWLVPEGKEPPKPTPTLNPNQVVVRGKMKTKKRK